MHPPHEAHLRRLAQRETAHVKNQLARLERLVLAAFDSGLRTGQRGVDPQSVREELRSRLRQILDAPVPPLECNGQDTAAAH